MFSYHVPGETQGQAIPTPMPRSWRWRAGTPSGSRPPPSANWSRSPAAAVLLGAQLVRMRLEERALEAEFPEYAAVSGRLSEGLLGRAAKVHDAVPVDAQLPLDLIAGIETRFADAIAIRNAER